MTVLETYKGSSGAETIALYERLAAVGPAGEISINLLRACKCSDRAKGYRSGRFRRDAYDRKNWSISNLCAALGLHGAELGIEWGWREDPAQEFYKWVLYVEAPTGQISFHSASRLAGPDYLKPWDNSGTSADRSIRWASQLLGEQYADEISDSGQTGNPVRAVQVSQATQRLLWS